MEPVGAVALADGLVRFEVWAPSSKRVELKLRGQTQSMDRSDRGYHRVVTRADHGDRYTFLLESAERPDPASRWQPEGIHGPSAVMDPATFNWTDDRWRGLDMSDCVFYELHVGTFTAEGTFASAAAELPYLRDLGVTVVEVMPVAQFPGSRNWGYDGVYPNAVQDTYGGPEAFARFVDRCHAHDLAVCLDVVYNHLGPEGCYHRDFGPYFTDVYTTPWGAAINFDGSGSDEVRRYFIGNALQWFHNFHVDALRLDAIHGIVDRSAYPFLSELDDEVRILGRTLGRQLLLVSESDLNDVRVVARRDGHGHGHDAAWADDFHHAVHALLTGEREGYYADFGRQDDLASAMAQAWVYDGRYSVHRDRRHGNSPAQAWAERFVVCVQNHDQVGNRATGDRLSTLVDADRLRLAAGLMLLSPFPPLLFMGEEYGETAPFLYFIDHGDAGLAEAVRQGRRDEFASFDRTGEVPDPADIATFERSRPDPALRDKDGHRQLLDLYRELLRLRREHPALGVRPKSDTRAFVDADQLLLHRSGPGTAVRAWFNLSDKPRSVSGSDPLDVLIDSTDPRWGGPGRTTPDTLEAGASWTLAPWAFVAAGDTTETHS